MTARRRSAGNNDPGDAAQRLGAWGPFRTFTDLVHVVADTWRMTGENHARLIQIGDAMADVSALLNEVANGLRGPLSTSITELLAERDRLAARNAEHSGEDAAEATAAKASASPAESCSRSGDTTASLPGGAATAGGVLS